MDIDALAKGVGIFGSALAALKQAIDLLPGSAKKTNAIEALEKAARAFKTAEAESAQQLGYQICRKLFPPEVMLSSDIMLWECPKCGNKMDTTPRAVLA